MKSMDQMQDEILRKCPPNGWPKPIVLFPGIVQLVYSQEEMDRAGRNEIIGLVVIAAVVAVVTVVIGVLVGV